MRSEHDSHHRILLARGRTGTPGCVNKRAGGQRRGASKRRSNRKRQRIGPIVTVVLLEETPAVLSLGKLCEDHGYTYHLTSGQKPHLTKKSKNIDSNISNYVPFLVPRLSTSSSTTPAPTSSSSSSQDPVFDVNRYTENPVQERSGSASVELRETRCRNQRKPKTKVKMKDAKKYTAIDCMTCRTGCRTSEGVWSVCVVLQSHCETLRLRIETLTVLLVNYQWSREQKWNRVRESMVSTRTFRREITRASCRRRAGTVVPRAENLEI